MKKLFATIAIVFMAVTASYAQTTFNIRVGAGLHQVNASQQEYVYSSYLYSSSYYYNYVESYPATDFVFGTNIPLGDRTSKFVFSPTLFFGIECSELAFFTLNVPLYFGYKVPIRGGSSLFIPKIGPMLGADIIYSDLDDDSGFNAGLSTEFAFEIKHFIIAANVDINFINDVTIGTLCTLGYKF